MAAMAGRLYTRRAMLRNIAAALLPALLPALLLVCAASTALAREDVHVWHALTGAQALELEQLAARFNASQRQYRVVPSYKGPLEVAFARALATKRSASAPHILQVHEALTGDLLAEQLVMPLWQVMAGAKEPFAATLLPAVTGAFSDER